MVHDGQLHPYLEVVAPLLLGQVIWGGQGLDHGVGGDCDQAAGQAPTPRRGGGGFGVADQALPMPQAGHRGVAVMRPQSIVAPGGGGGEESYERRSHLWNFLRNVAK